MLDKIRLHAAGRLPEAYIANLGLKFDERCLRFLGVDYEALKRIVVAGASDEEAWEWCRQHGTPRTEEETMVWNSFMTKNGWHDEMTEALRRRLQEGGWDDRTDIQTFFDYIDLDEGRKK
jgi:gluconokinase